MAANPEWRPGDDWKLTFDGESWQWVEHYSGCPVAEYPLKSVVQPFLLAALLPRAIAKWEHKNYLVVDSRKNGIRIYNALEACPRDLESAINILEGA